MKMNRLFVTGALLLGSLSALGLTAFGHNEAFEIGETKASEREILRSNENSGGLIATEGAVDSEGKPLFENGTSTKVSQAISQIKPGVKPNTTDMRLVSAIHIDLTENPENKLKPFFNAGGKFGFHIAYDRPTIGERPGATVNKNIQTSKYFMSIAADFDGNGEDDHWYYGNEFSSFHPNNSKPEFKNPSINEWMKLALGEETNPNNFNAFITMEIRNIPNSFVNVIQVQPYFIANTTEENQEPVIEYAKYSKKADISGLEMAWAEINGTKTLLPKVNNERILTDVKLSRNDTVKVIDSYGNVVNDAGIDTGMSEGVFTSDRNGTFDIKFNKEYTGLGESTICTKNSSVVNKTSRIYVDDNNWKWAEFSLYCFNDNGENNGWPGISLIHDHDNIYYADVDTNKYTKVIITGKQWDVAKQSVDVDLKGWAFPVNNCLKLSSWHSDLNKGNVDSYTINEKMK